MLLSREQLIVNISRSNSDENPATDAINNWLRGLEVLDEYHDYAGKDFSGRRILVEHVA